MLYFFDKNFPSHDVYSVKGSGQGHSILIRNYSLLTYYRVLGLLIDYTVLSYKMKKILN